MQKNNNMAVMQYLNSQVSMNDVKTVNTAEENAVLEDKKLKEKLAIFDNIKTLKEAEEKVKELFGAKDEISYIKMGNSYVTIQKNANKLTIIVNSDKELICYNFDKK